jgi:hypothetical protein
MCLEILPRFGSLNGKRQSFPGERCRKLQTHRSLTGVAVRRVVNCTVCTAARNVRCGALATAACPAAARRARSVYSMPQTRAGSSGSAPPPPASARRRLSQAWSRRGSYCHALCRTLSHWYGNPYGDSEWQGRITALPSSGLERAAVEQLLQRLPVHCVLRKGHRQPRGLRPQPEMHRVGQELQKWSAV